MHPPHEYKMQGFTSDDYSIDKSIKSYQKWHVFEINPWFAFCHVCRMSVAYKIGQNDFDAVFLLDSLEN